MKRKRKVGTNESKGNAVTQIYRVLAPIEDDRREILTPSEEICFAEVIALEAWADGIFYTSPPR
jgi:hypothetical protein